MISTTSREELLDQFAYLADELEAERSVLPLIPEPLFAVVPPGAEQSLIDLYTWLAVDREAADRLELAPWLEGPSAAPDSAASGSAAPGSTAPGSAGSGSAAPGSAGSGSSAPGFTEPPAVETGSGDIVRVARLIEQAVVSRRALAADLDAIPTERWFEERAGTTLAECVYRLIQDDTETLRRIAERLFEGGLRGRI